MHGIEQTLSSIEVAEMIEKEHSKLLRDLRRYEEQFAEAKIGLGDFFYEIKLFRRKQSNTTLLSYYQERL